MSRYTVEDLFTIKHSTHGDKPWNWSNTRYPAILLSLALTGVKRVVVEDVESFIGIISHPSLNNQGVDGVVLTADNKAEVTLYGVTLVYEGEAK